METDKNFKPGEVVVWRSGGTWDFTETWGRVSRVTPKGTVFAKVKDTEVEFRGGRGLRRPSEDEVAHRKWFVNRPRSSLAAVATRFRTETPCGATVAELDTPEKIREAAAALIAIADWWESEPKTP